MSDFSVFIFSALTFIVAIPSAIKVFNWIATLYKGSIALTPPMLFALAFIFLFSVGGLTGLMLGSAGTDVHLHDTAFVVGHFHFVMFGGTAFAFFAGLHFWFPKMFGRMYNQTVATYSLSIMTVGFLLHYVPMMVMGIQGLPRRYHTYLPEFTHGNILAGIGGFILIAGLFLMFFNLWRGMRKGTPCHERNPWGATTMEWTTPTPPPHENFDGPLEVPEYPYDFTKLLAKLKAKKGQ